MNQIELIEELRFYLRNFNKRGNVWNFSCPICGDSKKDNRKARGYIYKKQDKFNMTCKNCDAGMSLFNFIKLVAPNLYHHFLVKRIQDKEEEFSFSTSLNTPIVVKKEQRKELSFSFLVPYFENRKSLDYIEQRQIPKSKLKEVFYLDDLNLLITQFEHLGYTPLSYISPRLVFVIRNNLNEQVGFVTRSLNKNDYIRYYNIKIEEKEPLLYGTPFLNPSKPVWIVEGIIDSLFLSNGVAACSSSFSHAIEYCQYKDIPFVCVFDNERHNPQIVKIMDRAINKGYSLVIFSSFPFPGKDLNEMVIKNQWDSNTLQTHLQQHIFQSIRAKLEFDRWKKGF